MDFHAVDRRYAELKHQHESGTLSTEEFDAQLEQLRVQDDQGHWWTKSRETGGWHYHDGDTWVQGTPPAYRSSPQTLSAESAPVLGGFFKFSERGTNLREAVMNAIPLGLKFAIAVGIGLFIAFIGLKNAGIVAPDPVTYLRLGEFTRGPVLLATFGLALTLALVARGLRGGLIIGILVTGLVGMIFGIVPLPGGVVSFSFDTSTIGGGVLALPDVLRLSLVPIIFALFMTDFFDTMGTVIAVGQEGKFLDEEGRLPGLKRILLVDSLAAVGGGAAGASSVTSYIESGAGVAEGGRTGLTSVVVGLLFLLALPFSPLISVFGGAVPIPGPENGDILVSPVTAPALIVVVGFLMMTAVRFIPWERADEAIPAFLTILTLPLTFNISYGIGFGFISYVLIKLARGKPGEVHPLLYVTAILFALVFIWPALQSTLS